MHRRQLNIKKNFHWQQANSEEPKPRLISQWRNVKIMDAQCTERGQVRHGGWKTRVKYSYMPLCPAGSPWISHLYTQHTRLTFPQHAFGKEATADVPGTVQPDIPINASPELHWKHSAPRPTRNLGATSNAPHLQENPSDHAARNGGY